MSNRRGFALLAALWFIVAIAAVGLALGLEAAEHRSLGLGAADRRAGQAAVTGGVAIARARLEQALRQLPSGSAPNQLRASEPWLDADSLFPPDLTVGAFAVRLHAEDLGAKVNINRVNLTELRAFLGFVLRDYGTADALAQAIIDWRDHDDLSQPRGGERKDYLAQQRLDLPTNRGGFRELDELRSVLGMTPEIFAGIRPYLRTLGHATINVNTAPPAVLWAIPGMNDAIVTRILAVRSQQQRIISLQGLGIPPALQQRIGLAVTFAISQLELTVTAVPAPPAHVVQETWTIDRAGDQARLRWTDLAS